MTAAPLSVARPRGGVAFPLLLVAAGIYVYLVNNGAVPVPRWTDVLALWPLLLVAAGIDILIGRRSAAGAALASAALIAAAFVALSLAPVVAPVGSSQRAAIPLAGATSGRVDLAFGGGRLAVAAGGDGFATISSAHEDVRTTVDQAGSRLTLVARQPDAVPLWGRDWDVRLAPGVAHDLALRLGAGEMRVDLSGLRVSALELEAGAADVRLVLPRPDGERTFFVAGGASRITIEVPAGVEARILRTGGLITVSGPVETAGFAQARDRVTVDVRAGLSSIRVVQLP